MNQRRSHFLRLLICTNIIIALFCSSSLAGTCKQWAGKVVSVQGTVQVKKAGETEWQPVKLNDTYCPGDMIRVLERSRADIALINQPVLRLDQNSTITLGGMKEEKTSVINLVKGAAHFFSRATRNLEVQTAFVNAGIEGTEFLVSVEENKTSITMFEGKVLASNEAGSVTVTSGQSAVAERGKSPVVKTVVRPWDVVQWMLYYPPVVYERPEGLKENDPRFYTYRASSLLHVGRVDEAKADIGRALELDPNNSIAFALQSIIAVTQNEKEKALDLAKKAVKADPNSAAAHVALSYAQQANFDLNGALASLKEAVRVEPNNALAWARLSEIQLSFSNLDDAMKAAQKAVELNPNIARTQSVLGYAYLMRIQIKESMAAFEKAITLDQADPLPRLGLGLAKIRQGDLEGGRAEIEVAVSLDPNNALIRSYMGKAYYEEKKDKIATDQYKMAKELDPLDPTSFFYDAINKQTTNRPVEALQDIQKAIELNDNRMVYRSKQLLDEDLAARSAGLARIYTDLGFQELALVEGWKSVNTDPADFSGHRFLADTYSALPRHEIARVSELLQSQLLQPLNMTPIQPRLAESNLFLISAGGPGDLSFNEFNPLFNRDGFTLQANGLAGENGTWAGEGVLAGIYKKASFSVGYSHFETDGWRDNADQRDNIANAFLQIELSPKTSVQVEYRYRDTKYGDLGLRFFEDDFGPNLRNEDERNSVRLGFHQKLSPGSDLIGNFMYQNADVSRIDSPAPFLPYMSDKFDDDAFNGELQYLYRSKNINLVGGAGYFGVDSDWHSVVVIDFPPPTPSYSSLKRNIDHTNLYLYSYSNFLKNTTFTVGATGDFYQGGLTDENQFNPKFGVTWNPFPDTTLRGAVFRAFKRTLITNQTLEPTQVAGFNQFFDDTDETDAWNYGIAVDQKFSKSLFAGAEFFLRDLEFPFQNWNVTTGATYVDENKWHERVARAYIYWTPHKWFALTAEYLFEQFERDKPFTLGLKKVDTHRVPLGINFYHPCGLSVMLKGTYVNQDGEFERQNPFPTQVYEHGDDRFFLLDAAINYRLPKRYGFITFGVKNLTDESFSFYDTDAVSPAIQPTRTIFGKLTLSF